MSQGVIVFTFVAVLLAIVGSFLYLPDITKGGSEEPQTPLQKTLPFLIFPFYVVFLAIVGFLVPGYYHKGVPTLDGNTFLFKINGLRVLVVLLCACAAGVHFGLFKATLIYDNFTPLFLSVNVAAFLLSVVLYVKGISKRRAGQHNKDKSPEKGFLHDFVMGTELMPHLLGINVKFFWLRPALMGWLLINLSLAAKQYSLLGEISTGMLLYQLFVFFYVVDYFWFEEYMTSTWDIIAENFGLMLVWGDIVWIPFVFSIQAWFLIEDNTPLSPYQIAGMVATFILGYTIFRGCNKQKHDFKHNPRKPIWGKPPVVIGDKLLASGWWGLARHLNYTGDIILGIAFSLPCRFESPFPWIYPIYLTILLIQRERRDDEKCSEKYSKFWAEYCKAVPFRMIPYVY